MPETVVIAAGSMLEARRFIEGHLLPDDKPIVVTSGRECYHLHGLKPDRVIRLQGFYKRDDREFMERSLQPLEQFLLPAPPVTAKRVGSRT